MNPCLNILFFLSFSLQFLFLLIVLKPTLEINLESVSCLNSSDCFFSALLKILVVGFN